MDKCPCNSDAIFVIMQYPPPNRARPVSRDPGNHSRRDTPPNQTSKGTAGNTQLMRTASRLLVIIAAPGWLANWAHFMKPFGKCRVQFVSDAFALVSYCPCVLLPRSLGMCLSTWAMRNLKRLESTRLVTDTKSSRQLKKNSLAYQNWVSEKSAKKPVDKPRMA